MAGDKKFHFYICLPDFVFLLVKILHLICASLRKVSNWKLEAVSYEVKCEMMTVSQFWYICHKTEIHVLVQMVSDKHGDMDLDGKQSL